MKHKISKNERMLKAQLNRSTRLLCGILLFMKDEPFATSFAPYENCKNNFDVLLQDIDISIAEEFECESDNVFQPLVDLREWWAEHETADICQGKPSKRAQMKSKKISKFNV